ncbi:hypothetical protein CYY_002868 [Polysphondylium violaceum]|uniref:Methyltransferase type 11 domain-containing protein n=1 Tax=Polysphondylium violaceum TaxID=133409 RepID=A0A8J4Q101_9MYCE|nr:hypothetical protein CYY_002868 [Polysphondylium violaceum]
MTSKLESDKSNYKVVGDMFGAKSQQYRAFRPQYPQELFDILEQFLDEKRDLALDVGCGSGQATTKLSTMFKKVIGTDPSENQIKNAIQAENIEYKVLPAEDSDLESNLFDLITVAQAIHWFNLPVFFQESKRLLRKDGILAFWAYTGMKINNNEEGQKIHQKFYDQVLVQYLTPKLDMVNNGYRDIIPPFENVTRKVFPYIRNMSIGGLLGFYSSLSGYQKFILANPDPLPEIKESLIKTFNTTDLDAPVVEGYWDIYIVICK